MTSRRHSPFLEPLLRAATAWSLRYLVASGCPLYVVALAVVVALMVTRSPAVLIALCDPSSDLFNDLSAMLAGS